MPRRKSRPVPGWVRRRPGGGPPSPAEPETPAGRPARQEESPREPDPRTLRERLESLGLPADNPQTRAAANGHAPAPPAPKIPGVLVAGDVLSRVIAEAQQRAGRPAVPETSSEAPAVPREAAPSSRPGPAPKVKGLLPEPDPAALTAVVELAETLHPRKGFGSKVRAFRRTFPLAWIERILVESAGWAELPGTFNPLRGNLQKWEKAGGPPEIDDLKPRVPARVNGGLTRAEREEFLRQQRASDES